MSLAFLKTAPRFLFFTGKGGVGKTSIACACAVTLADRGRRVLLVSTDPASNLDAVLQTELGSHPRPVEGARGLFAMNIDPEKAAQEYRQRTIDPYRGTLPEIEIALLEERLAGACTVEIAAFDEFTLLLDTTGAAGGFDHVIFDTAPTGHTLRLLQLPAAWTGFMTSGNADASCLGPLSGLKAQRERYEQTVKSLADDTQTLLVLVTRPDRVALIEADRTSRELGGIGIKNQFLVVNTRFHATDATDALALAFDRRAEQALAAMPAAIAALPRAEIEMRPFNIVGLSTVRAFLEPETAPAPDDPGDAASVDATEGTMPLAKLVDDIERTGHGLVMIMGKGGVGKTTIAAAISVALAARGHAVHLTTTDPAAHLDQTLPGTSSGLRQSRIDPAEEARRYRDQMLASKGANLDAQQRALLEEELRSPCYDEIAVFLAFTRLVVSARREFVIMDTAPTGHTLLLLDTAGAYHRQIVHDERTGSARIVTPLMMLQDAAYSKIIIVALPEPTPVLEAQALQEDLRRASIEPYAWVINGSLAAAQPHDPVLASRARAELKEIKR